MCPASGIWNGGGTGLLNAPYKFGSPLTNRGRRRPAPIPPPTFQAPLLPRRGTRAPVLARLPACPCSSLHSLVSKSRPDFFVFIRCDWDLFSIASLRTQSHLRLQSVSRIRSLRGGGRSSNYPFAPPSFLGGFRLNSAALVT